jgi:hypothetical protein
MHRQQVHDQVTGLGLLELQGDLVVESVYLAFKEDVLQSKL